MGENSIDEERLTDSDLRFDRLTLVVPAKSDVERDAIADVWDQRGGKVLRLDRFWQPPELSADRVRLYGNHTFCLVLAEIWGLELVSPADEWLISIDDRWLKRKVQAKPLSQVVQEDFPQFVKPKTYVVDVGYIPNLGWALIEINPTWSAGLNGCDPLGAAQCIAFATRPTSR